MPSGIRCKLTARWPGIDPPRPGQFLKAPRGRTAYEIVEVRQRKSTGQRNYNLLLICNRWRPADVPEGATIRAWYWDKRQKTRRS